MKPLILQPLLLSALLLPLAACNVEKPLETARDAVASQESSINQSVRERLDKAKTELETGNLSLNGGNNVSIGKNVSLLGKGNDQLPKAEITPQGELLIEGDRVALTPEQEALVRAYRRQLIGIAQAGIDIGSQGAELGLKAAGMALSGLLDGGVDESAIKAEAAKIKTQARQLCTQLPALLQAQQALAAKVAEFQPYASLTSADIDECEKRIDADTGTEDSAGDPADPAPAFQNPDSQTESSP